MRYFFRRRVPELSRILLVESGSRQIIENVIPRIQTQFGDAVPIDLVTCLSSRPAGFARIYDVNDYRGRRGALARELRANRYAVAGILCSGERILSKWKWGLVLAVPAKFLVINENADYFWLDRGHWANLRQFIKVRAGFADAGIVRAFARVVVLPFTFSFLLLYAAAMHLRRALYRGLR
ncbi:MAG: hypothetical protein LAP39_04050 [Acidobacteriia bacterium]|nr:hypothetical protein [Terriglobia bacterium]